MATPPVRQLSLALCAFLACLTGCTGSKILVVPNQSLSHTRYFAQVSQPLIEKGHQVVGIMNGACKKSVSTLEQAGVQVMPYFTADQSCFTEKHGNLEKGIFTNSGSSDPREMIAQQSVEFLVDGDAIFGNKALFSELAAEKFDLCILDGFLITLWSYLIPYKLDLPYISLTTGFIPTSIGVPALPSFSPLMLAQRSDKMTFQERLLNTLDTILVPAFLQSIAGSQDSLIERFVPEKPRISLMTLVKRSQLWLVNTDPVLDYPRATLPHIINIGGLSTAPPKPLPADLQAIMDGAKKGAVILSFGSLANDLPTHIIDNVIRAFMQLKGMTFIMKYNGSPIKNLPSNIHLLPWLPQNDILAHPSVRIFITHSGNNGQFEGLYHGVPMIALPLFGDQPYNGHRMAVKGFGIAMDTFSFTSEELVSNIKKILTDDSYKAAIGKASQIYRSQFQTPRERAVYWIEHVLNYGSSHLVSYATELPWYQYWLIDVFICLYTIIAGAVVISFLLLRTCYRMLVSGNVKEKQT